jgi:hypothetical protein
MLSIEKNQTALEEFRERLIRLNPAAKMIVTVSPVPLEASFTGPDVLSVNTLSKSILRVAADALAKTHDDVDYFPSYEMIVLGDNSYAPDWRHVSDRAVSKVVSRFLYAYMGIEAVPNPFNEGAYLYANPDVDALVRAGEFDSGYAHWVQQGHKEERRLIPLEPPPERYLEAGGGW